MSCPQCGSNQHKRHVTYADWGRDLISAALVFTCVGIIFVPFVVPAARWKCEKCGHVWVEERRNGEVGATEDEPENEREQDQERDLRSGKTYEYRAKPEVFVTLEALELHGETVEAEKNGNTVKNPGVYWKGKQRECGRWSPVKTSSSEPPGERSSRQDTDRIRYLKELRNIIESDLRTEEKIEKINGVAERFSNAPEIEDDLLRDPAGTYYRGLLQSIPGVGEKKAKKLFSSGFYAPKHLVNSSKTELTELPGIGEKTAETLIEGAKEANRKVRFQ